MVTPSRSHLVQPTQVFAGPEKWGEVAADGDTGPSLSLVLITIFPTPAIQFVQYLGDPTLQVSLLLMHSAQ